MKEIKVRIEDDIYIKLKKESDTNGCFISEVIRSILSSWVNGCEKTIKVITRRDNEKNKWKTKLKERFVMSKLTSEFDDFAMNIIVRKEEYNISQDDINEDVEIMINALTEEIKNLIKFSKEHNYLTTLKLKFQNKSFDVIKKIINYEERRMRWIINKKIKPTKLELDILMNRVNEIKQQEMVANDRRK